MSGIYYLAYGSNLHPVRLGERIPSARLIGTAHLPGYRLTFHKRGVDNSGKGHIHHSRHHNDRIFSAIYEMAAEHKPLLDAIEGHGYCSQSIDINLNNQNYSCFSYLAVSAYLDKTLKPFHWYKTLVVLGAEHHGFPSGYIDAIKSVESVEDPDLNRRAGNQATIEQIRAYQCCVGNK